MAAELAAITPRPAVEDRAFCSSGRLPADGPAAAMPPQPVAWSDAVAVGPCRGRSRRRLGRHRSPRPILVLAFCRLVCGAGRAARRGPSRRLASRLQSQYRRRAHRLARGRGVDPPGQAGAGRGPGVRLARAPGLAVGGHVGAARGDGALAPVNRLLPVRGDGVRFDLAAEGDAGFLVAQRRSGGARTADPAAAARHRALVAAIRAGRRQYL